MLSALRRVAQRPRVASPCFSFSSFLALVAPSSSVASLTRSQSSASASVSVSASVFASASVPPSRLTPTSTSLLVSLSLSPVAPRISFSSSPVTPTTPLSERQNPVESATRIRYKRLVYQSLQRGWLELDLIMGSWVTTNEALLTNNDRLLDQLAEVCKEENSDLIRWFVEGKPVPETFAKNEVMQAMLAYAYAPNKPWYPKQGNQ